MADIGLNIIIRALNATGPAFASLGASAKATQGVLQTTQSVGLGLGKVLLGVGLVGGVAMAAIGVASIKMAADYQQSMNKVQALTGSSDAQMKQYDAGLKQLATNAGVAPKALADGLYNVLSAGYAGAGAMRVLTLATEDAKIGMTDASTTTNALTNVMANFKVGASGANIVNGEMLKTVTLGKATFSQYATTITKAASTSAQYSQSMETMNAAWATLTASGISAGMATTDYDQSLKVMDGNIGTVTKSLHKNGIAFNETAFNAMDYGHKVVYLNSALQQARDKHVSITGATVQATQAIKTISDHIGIYNNDLSTLSNKQAMARQTAQSWATTQGGFNQTMSRLGAAVQVAMIGIGQKLLPVITKAGQELIPLVSKFMDWANKNHIVENAASMLGGALGGLITGISKLGGWLVNIANYYQHNKGAMDELKGTLIIAAGVIGTVLVVAFGAWAIAAGAAAIATLAAMWPVLLIGVVVGVVALLIISRWKQIAPAFQFVGKMIGVMINNTITALHALGINVGKTTQQMQEEAALHSGQMKDKTLANTAAMQQKSISQLEAMRAGIEDKLKHAKTAAEKHALEMQLKVVNAHLIMKTVSLQHTEELRKQNAAKMAAMRAKMEEESKTLWQHIGDWFSNIYKTCVKWIQSTYNDVVQWFQNLGTNTVKSVQTMWQNISNFFSSAWQNYIVTPLNNLQSSISGWFTNLAGQAVQWGANIVNGIANGIRNAVGAVTNAIGSVTNAIGKFLPHSPAEQGELSHLNEYGPALVSGFSQGIIASIPMMTTAIGQLTGGIGTGLASHPLMSPMAAPIAAGFRADPYNKASQLDFTQAPTEIYRSKLAPHETKAQKQKTAQTLAAEWKVVDAELKAIQVRGSAQLKNDRATYAAEIKAIQEHDKHLKGNAKKAGEEEIKMLRAQEKARLANERSTLAGKLKAARAQEKQIKQEIKLELHVHANKMDATEMDKIAIYTVKHFGDQIRNQFGNV